jgi:sulfatase maturation enzyme AslB (radical SAM superfamily)
MKYRDNKPISSQLLKAISRTMFITFMVTKKCNLKCSYCDVITGKEKSRYVSIIDFWMFLKWIKLNSTRPNIAFSFFGGEPSLNPNINKFTGMLKSKFEGKRNLEITMTTNLMKPKKYWIKLDKDIKIAASYHNNKLYKKWFEKALILKNKDQLHHVVLMLTNDNHKTIIKAYKKYSKILPCIICPINQMMGSEYIKFKNDMIEELGKDPFEDSEKELFYDKMGIITRHMCSSGYIIDEYGYVYRCWPEYNQKFTINRKSIFEHPNQVIPIWHMCYNYTEACDKEVIRSSMYFYKNKIFPCEYDKNEYTNEELKKYLYGKTLMRCNG